MDLKHIENCFMELPWSQGLLPMSYFIGGCRHGATTAGGGAGEIYSPVVEMEAITGKILEINTRGQSRIKQQEIENKRNTLF